MDYASLGTHRVSGNFRSEVGWVAPSLIYDQMRDVDSRADALNGDVPSVASQPFKDSWATWYRNWKAFYAAKKGLYAELGNLFGTDELKAQVDFKQNELNGFYSLYAQQTLPGGGAVPQPSSPSPGPPPQVPPQTASQGILASIPWWAWGILGVSAAGVGYSFYRAAKQAHADKERLMNEVVPYLVPGMHHPGPSTP